MTVQQLGLVDCEKRETLGEPIVRAPKCRRFL